MALSFTDCFNVQKYSTHMLLLKYPGKDGDSEVPADASQVVKKGKRKRVTLPESTVAQSVHVNAAILAMKSDVLDRLLNSEMQGENAVPSVALQSEEEAGLMITLLKFCYSPSAVEELAASKEKLLALLVLADQFGVTECIQACADILGKSLMTVEDASLYLNLPAHLRQQPALSTYVELSSKALTKLLKNLDELFQSERYLSLSLEVLKLALGSKTAQVGSENTCFCIVWGWIGEHCKGPSARKAALGELLPLLRFGRMTGDFLLAIANQPDMTRPSAAKLIREALRFRMGLSANNMSCFALSSVSKRPSSNSLNRFEGMAESTLVGMGVGDLISVPDIFVDGFMFELRIVRVSDEDFKMSLFVKSWKQLQSKEDRVSLFTRLSAIGNHEATLLQSGQSWQDVIVGWGHSIHALKLLTEGGKSLQRKYLSLPERMMVVDLLVIWRN